jgi:hypothetical protein
MDPVMTATPSPYANPTQSKAMPQETVEDAYLALRQAAEEAAQAGAQFLASRGRWQAAQAQLAEANTRVEKARDSAGA